MTARVKSHSLNPLADGVWVESAPVQFLGMRLTSTMTVLRLSDGSLLVHSPVAMTPERRAQIEALGTASSAGRHPAAGSVAR